MQTSKIQDISLEKNILEKQWSKHHPRRTFHMPSCTPRSPRLPFLRWLKGSLQLNSLALNSLARLDALSTRCLAPSERTGLGVRLRLRLGSVMGQIWNGPCTTQRLRTSFGRLRACPTPDRYQMDH